MVLLQRHTFFSTNVMRQFWRGCGLLALMYLDDGIGENLSRENNNISVQVRKDLASAGFTCIDEKYNWEPVQKLVVFFGTVLDFEAGLISIPEERILKLKSSIDSCLQDNFISAKALASINGQIISMSCAVGNGEPPGINFCSCLLKFVTSLPFGKATSTPLMGSQFYRSLVLWELFILTQVILDLVVILFDAARI